MYICVCVCEAEKCVNDSIKYRSTNLINFIPLNLSEKFVEKQKLQSLFLLEKFILIRA